MSSEVTASTSQRDVAFIVCTALERDGLRAVLTGGGAASIWAPEAVQSDDLDYVLTLRTLGEPRGLLALGYREQGGLYVHSENRYTIEFPPGPLAVAGELITQWDTLRETARILHVLTPTDSCRDRLAAFLHWRDHGALNQAVAVVAAQPKRIDLQRIEAWCRREGKPDEYRQFTRLLARQG